MAMAAARHGWRIVGIGAVVAASADFAFGHFASASYR